MAKNKDEIVFLPLGGCGEIGMNLNLYGFGTKHKKKWIIVDIGVTFGGAETPGIDIIMPDIEFLADIKDDILAIILTHAHEDHMGALARLWTRIGCPVYATPFTHYLTEGRLAEVGLLGEVELHKIDMKARFQLGPFDLELITLTHSIPEPNAIAIRTPAGLILHTGDWKIDDDPEQTDSVDIERLKAVGDEGVLAIVCDSTNVFSPGTSGSEAGVRVELTKLIGEYKGRGMAVASFASNVTRLESVMLAARANDRSVCLVGRSMHRMTEAAKAVGLLSKVGTLLSEDEAAAMPSAHVLYLCTGSQGEPRAALSRIAKNEHRTVKFGKGDVVIFSSKIIPGNEIGIFALQNSLADNGIEIVTEKSRDIHVSGHPCRDELKQMYEWTRPHISIPVHGERRHLLEHAKLAKAKFGVQHALAPHNGEMILINTKGAKIVDIVPNGRLHEDGRVIVSAEDPSLRERRKLAYSGHMAVSVVINAKGQLIGGPEPRASGFPHGNRGQYLEELLDQTADIAEQAFYSLKREKRSDEDEVEERIRSKVRRLIRERTGKRAVVEVTAIKV
ncbi:MAG: MBL fold metallo-hydrolase [Robiginitomaculum sp.]|nr:MAG: MBL fold metallo-hydrolase [Robiginitomaculum sp.]